jgi:ATP-dependent helicase HrpA
MQADQKHARFKDERSDFIALIKLWEDFEEQKKHLSRAKIRGYCRDSFLSFVRMREWQETHAQILEVIKGEFEFKLNSNPAEYLQIHQALLAGLLSNVCLKQEQSEYAGARGSRLHIHPGSFLFKPKPKWIMSAEQVETTKVYARTVAAIEPEWIERVGAHLVKQQHYDPHWERKSARVAVHERTQLFGLTIQAGRKIPYERVNPVEAREMFIRNALVQMDYDSRAPFMQHNFKLLEEADYLQQKGRRVDLMVDELWLYRFFDERIPPEVVNGVSFEVWRKVAESENPGILKLTRDDITVKVDDTVDDRNFPDHCMVGGIRVTLQYRFEPGHLDDGVSALIPLQLLNTLEPGPFRWLVPGMLRDKVITLLKSLPKTLRIHFVPVPDYADRILPMLDFAEGDLLQQLSLALKRTGGIAVPVSAFREELVPDHLKTNFLVLGEDQRVMDRGRDLEVLKQKHSKDAGKTFKQIASEAYLKTGGKEWIFGDLPLSIDGEHDGSRVFGYPGLVDEGESVGLRILESREEAQLVHEGGLARLMALALSKDLKYIRKNLRVDAVGELGYARLALHPFLYKDLGKERALRDDLLTRLLAGIFLEDQPEIRTEAEFNQRLEAHRKNLVSSADEMGGVAQKIMQIYAEVARALENTRDARVRDDIRQQLDRMIYLGFWIKTPWAQIREFPRYLTAALHRIQKAQQDPGRDARQRQEIEPFQKAFWSMIEKYQGRRIPERHPFRWKLEEFRVSLFAQQLKTAYPISSKRMSESLKTIDPSA